MVDTIKQGKELGDVVDDLLNDRNTKQKQGAIGCFTRGIMDRTHFLRSGSSMRARSPAEPKTLF